jgi:hypothetical protein
MIVPKKTSQIVSRCNAVLDVYSSEAASIGLVVGPPEISRAGAGCASDGSLFGLPAAGKPSARRQRMVK